MKKLLVFGLSLLLSSTALEAKASYDNPDHAEIAFVSEVLLSFVGAGKDPALFDITPRRIIALGIGHCNLRRFGVRGDTAVKQQIEKALEDVYSYREKNVIRQQITAITRIAPKYYCPEQTVGS